MKAKIHYYDIGDYLSREEKLKTIERFGSIENIPWTIIEPNEHGDWLNKRSELFNQYALLGNKEDKKDKQDKHSFFVPYYSRGIATCRDGWDYNSSKKIVQKSAEDQIDFYNEQRIKLNNREIEHIDFDTNKISWTRAVLSDISKNKPYNIDKCEYRESIYRPFYKQHLIYYRPLNEMMYQIPKLFPTPKHKNLVICVSGVGASKDFSTIITNCIPDIQLQFNGQCFPLYWYDDATENINEPDLFSMPKKEFDRYVRCDGITKWILTTARKQYGNNVTKEDIFYYVYGILHSPDYRTAFAADLKKSLPRLPLVESSDDFWAFSHAGRELAELHLNYETVEPYKSCISVFAASTTKGENVNYQVEKMRFGKIDSKTADKTIIHYNNGITIENIPLEAYEYVINGKSAIEWIMERYQITTNKDSGIINDPNDWAKEHNDEKYIFNLLLRIINVSIQTMEIVKALPKLKFEE